MTELDLFRKVLEINIQSLEELINDCDALYERWRLLIDNFHCSKEQLLDEITRMLHKFKLWYVSESLPDLAIHSINIKWFNTLRSTFYMIEDEYINNNGTAVFMLWEWFFKVESLQGGNYLKLLGLYKD